MKKVGILLSMVLYINIISAQSWEQLPMHGGGFVTGLIPHPTDENTLFARIDVAGIYKTTDGGDNWSTLTKELPKTTKYNYYARSFVLDVTNTDKMYFVTGNAPWDDGSITNESFLWLSSDGGTNWTQETAPINFSGNGQYRYAGETMLISPTNTDLLYIAGQPTYDWGTTSWNSDGGLYTYNITTDTWTQLDGGALDDAWITSIQYKPDDNDYIYISAAINTQTNLNSSTVGLWKYQISTGTVTQLRSTAVYDFIFDTGNANKIITIEPNGIDISTDNGSTWAGVTQPFGYDYNYFITAHPTNSDHWYIGYWTNFNENGILQTTDGGANYYETKFNTGTNNSKVTYPSYANNNYNPGFGNAMATLIFHPANTAKAYVSDWYGVFKTSDAATNLITNTSATNTENSNWSWDWKSQGIYNMVQVRTTLHPTDNTVFYNCLADIGLYIGTNTGTDCIYQTTHPITSIYGVQFAPSNTSTGYAVGAHHTSNGRIVKTTDGGTTWLEPSTNTQWGTSYFQTNGSNAVTDLQIADSDEDIVIVGVDKGSMSNQIYRSDDGGVTFSGWDDGITPSIFKKWTATDKLIKDADGETFYVWHQNYLYKRHLNDATWTAMTNPNGGSWFAQVVADPSNNNTIYATQYGNTIYKSIDGGSNWTTITSGTTRSTALAISKNGNIAVLQGEHANTATNQSLFVSKDGGTTWETVGLTNFYGIVSGIVFLGETTLIGWSVNTTAAKIDLTAVLPVSLVDFNANFKNGAVQLNWNTATELDNAGFEIQRGQKDGLKDEINWQRIGFVNGQGIRSTPYYYEYIDNQVDYGTYYYRLKQMDFDGEYEYSKTIEVTIEDNNSWGMNIFPNPTNDIITVESDRDLSSLTIEIYDILGQKIKTITNIENQISLKALSLNQGIYILKCLNGHQIIGVKQLFFR